MSNMTLNTKEYTGVRSTDGLSWWKYFGAGVAALFAFVNGRVTITDKARIRFKARVVFPQPEGAPVCCGPNEERVADADISVRFHNSLTEAERTDFELRLEDLMKSAQFRAAVRQLQQVD